jgi:hypothetical protein
MRPIPNQGCPGLVSSFDKYDAEFVRVRQLIARKHEHFPELSLAECAHLAVEELFDPHNEPNPALRAFLLARLSDVHGQEPGERAGKDSPRGK